MRKDVEVLRYLSVLLVSTQILIQHPYPDLGIVGNPANPTASNKHKLAESFGSVLRCFVANPAIGGNLRDTECNLYT